MNTDETTILVVDDDTVFRSRLARAFDQRGYATISAADVHEAEEMLRVAEVDWIVLDLNMPGKSGLELIPVAKELKPAVKIVVLTGYGSVTTALESVRRGAFNYLAKPVDADQIVEAFHADPLAPVSRAENSSVVPSPDQVEWEHLQRVLHDCGGNISQAAKLMGMHRRTLQRKLTKVPGR